MTQRVSSIRDLNKYDYSSDIRPYILTSINTNNTQSTASYLGLGGIGSSASVGGLTGIGDLDELNLTTLTVQELQADTINSFEISTQFLSGFAVRAGNDVILFGTDDNGFKKLFWDSSESHLYNDGKLSVQDNLLYLHQASDDREITQSNYDSDIGVFFKYYDTNYHGSKYGFFGFDGISHRFSLKESIGLADRKIIGDGTTQTLLIANLEANNLYVSKILQIENSNGSFDIIAQNGNDINIVSGNDLNFYGNNINFNISSGYQLVNTSSNTSFLNTSGNLNLLTVTGDINLDVEYGDIDIVIDGNSNNQLILQNTKGDIQILSGSTESDSILIDTDGGIQMNISSNLSINTNTESLSFNSTDGLISSVPKTNYFQWISFYKFNTYSGFYLTDRDYSINLGVTIPKHYWKKEKNNEISLIFTDVELSQNYTSQRGSRLEEIHFGYKIEDDPIISIFVRLTKKTFGLTNELNIINIPYNDISLNTGTTIGDHYGKIEISNPFFINDQSIINIEVEINTPSTSLFKFYGCNLKFSKNDL